MISLPWDWELIGNRKSKKTNFVWLTVIVWQQLQQACIRWIWIRGETSKPWVRTCIEQQIPCVTEPPTIRANAISTFWQSCKSFKNPQKNLVQSNLLEIAFNGYILSKEKHDCKIFGAHSSEQEFKRKKVKIKLDQHSRFCIYYVGLKGAKNCERSTTQLWGYKFRSTDLLVASPSQNDQSHDHGNRTHSYL